MKTLSIIITIIFALIGFAFKILFGILAFGFSILAAGQLAEDEENGLL